MTLTVHNCGCPESDGKIYHDRVTCADPVVAKLGWYTEAELLPRGIIPPGTYAGGARSPVVYVHLCPPCAGYAPVTSPDYRGFLSGRCQGCGSECRELHRFPALINSAAGCQCCGQHGRVTGDLRANGACDD